MKQKKHNILNLDKTDKKILYELTDNCRQPNSKIAKKLRVSRDVVNYRIKRMEEQGLITNYMTYINPAAFNRFYCKIYLRLQDLSPKVEEEITNFALNKKHICWIVRCDGPYDFIIATNHKHTFQFHEFQTELGSKFSKFILKKELSIQAEAIFLGRGYLLNKQQPKTPNWNGAPLSIKLDKTDLKILNEIGENARQPATTIAKKTCLTSRQVIYRIKELEKKQVAIKHSAMLNINKIGFAFYKIMLYTKNFTKKREKALIEYCRSIHYALYYVKEIGAWEVEIEFEAKNEKHMHQMMRDLRKEFGDIIQQYEIVSLSEEIKGVSNTMEGVLAENNN